jgi:hypothetical protein
MRVTKKLNQISLLGLLFFNWKNKIKNLKEINDLSTNAGSSFGGTILNINGDYLYTDDDVPAQIEIAGK